MGFALLKRNFIIGVAFPSLRMMLKQRDFSVGKKKVTSEKVSVRLISKVIQQVLLTNTLFRGSIELLFSLFSKKAFQMKANHKIM